MPSVNVVERIPCINVIIMDIDGVLTDGRIFYGPDHSIWKAFDVQDGHAVKMAQRAGLRCGVLSGRDDPANHYRSIDLELDFVRYGILDKAKGFQELCQTENIQPQHCLYIGDDVVDIPVMRQVAVSVAVANAVDEVKAIADWVTQLPGGRGAVREIIYQVLKIQGKWEKVMERYYSSTI